MALMASVADVPDPVRASTLEHARIDHRVTSLRPEIAVARSFFSLGTGDAIARFIAFVATLYLARTLGPRVYGMLVVAATVMAYVGQVADCGVDQLGIHDVARNRAQLTDLVSAYVGARLLVSGTIVVLLVAVAGVRYSSLGCAHSGVRLGR